MKAWVSLAQLGIKCDTNHMRRLCGWNSTQKLRTVAADPASMVGQQENQPVKLRVQQLEVHSWTFAPRSSSLIGGHALQITTGRGGLPEGVGMGQGADNVAMGMCAVCSKSRRG